MADSVWTVTGYTHMRELGSGASGRVMLAVRNATGERVAIKYLARGLLSDARFVERFRSEARLLAGLTSPHLVRVFDYVEAQQGAAIVMELVNGVSLRAVLGDRGPLTAEAALVVLKGSLQGLATAHAARVVHRDYKPENVLVPEEGGSRLVDFGIAVPAGTDVPYAGTPPYMAPEQWAGRGVSPATDVYAATAVFFECLTGAAPYHASTLAEWADAHQNAAIPTAALPAPLQPLVAAGMAKTADQRPASAAAFTQQLEAAATTAYGPDWETRGRRALAATVAGLAALLPLGLAQGTLTPATTTPATWLGQLSTEPGELTPPTRGSFLRRLSRKLTTKPGIAITAGAAAVALILGGGAVVLTRDGDTTSQPPSDTRTTGEAASSTPAASHTRAGPRLPELVCARFERSALNKLAKIFDSDVARATEQRAGVVGAPSVDQCTVELHKGGVGSPLMFGVSVLPANKHRLATLRHDYERAQGRFVDVRTVKGVGEGGYGTDRFVLVLAHGRLLKVSAGLPEGQSFGQLRKAAKVAIAHVAEIRDAPKKVTVGACERLTRLAEAALGGGAAVRRDTAAHGSQPLSCGWATKTAAVSVTGSRSEDAKEEFQINLDSSYKSKPLNVGDKGFYDAESTSAQYLIGEHLIVHVNYTPFGEGSKSHMIALTKASEPLYG